MKPWIKLILPTVMLLSCGMKCSESMKCRAPEDNIPITPAWALGHIVWEDEFNTQEAVLRLVNAYTDRDIPVDGVIIDSPWTTSYNNFVWDRNLYPEPEALTEELKERGVHSILWLTGCVNSLSNDCPVDKSSNFDELAQKGFAVNGGRENDWWKGRGMHVDFTNPDAVQWWYSQVDKIMAHGVDGFKVDQGELSVGDSVTTKAGVLSNKEFRPYYYDAMFDYVQSRRPGTGIILARPYSRQGEGNFSSKNKLSLGWCGDFTGEWDGLKNQIVDVYKSALEGYGAVGTEIGGYFGTPPGKAQLIRYAQFGAMTASMINGGGHGPFENHLPWWHGGDSEKIYHDLVALHKQLIPYIFSTLVEAHISGGALLRDVNFQEESHLLGPDIFTKAITSDNALARFTLPADGEWLDPVTGELFPGGSVVEKEYPLDCFPIFVRRGSIIPMQIDGRPGFVIVPGEKKSKLLAHLPVGDGTDYYDCRVSYNPKSGKTKIDCKTHRDFRVKILIFAE